MPMLVCDCCGESHPKREMTGLWQGGVLTWYCLSCVQSGRIGNALGRKMQAVRRLVDRAGGDTTVLDKED